VSSKVIAQDTTEETPEDPSTDSAIPEEDPEALDPLDDRQEYSPLYMELEGHFGSIQLGDTRDEVIEKIITSDNFLILDEESNFGALDMPRSNVVKARGMPYTPHVYFQFHEGRLFEIMIQYDPTYFSYADVYKRLRLKYGPCSEQLPQKATWQNYDSTEPILGISDSTSVTPSEPSPSATPTGETTTEPTEPSTPAGVPADADDTYKTTKIKMILHAPSAAGQSNTIVRILDMVLFQQATQDYDAYQRNYGTVLNDFVRNNPRRNEWLDRL